MSKTIAELRASKQAGRATWIYPLCLVGKINERFQAADAEVQAAVAERDQLQPPDPDDIAEHVPARSGEPGQEPVIAFLPRGQ